MPFVAELLGAAKAAALSVDTIESRKASRRNNPVDSAVSAVRAIHLPVGHEPTSQQQLAMEPGSVYVLFNPSYPDMVKIGRTRGSVQDRAKRLSRATGVPTPFIPAYDVLVDDCVAVEFSLHERLQMYRVNDRREFFRIPLREAIREVQTEAHKHLCADHSSQEQEILPALVRTHGKHRIREFLSVKIVNTPWTCWLETTRRKHMNIADEIVERVDLSFIASDDDYYEDTDEGMFPPKDGAVVNASRFLSLDLCSLAHCTDLLTDDASDLAVVSVTPRDRRRVM